MTFVYLQRNIHSDSKETWKVVFLALRAHSDILKANGFVITTGPLGFVLTKEVNVFSIESV